MFLISHSYNSLQYGTLSPESLAADAYKHNIKHLVLADINSTAGLPAFYKSCCDVGITAIAGADIRQGPKPLYFLIAMNNEGLREINEFISKRNIKKVPFPDRAPVFQNAIAVYPFSVWEERAFFDMAYHEYIGIRSHESGRLFHYKGKLNATRLLAYHEISFADSFEYELHLNLRAIHFNTLLSKLNKEGLASPYDHPGTYERALKAFDDYPFLIQNSKSLYERSSLFFDFAEIKNKKTFTGSAYDDKILLEKLAYDGLKYRYGDRNNEARARVAKELDIIDKLGFSAYFLISWDIIRYSMSRSFYHVGRGSGANSVVAYCLKITDVDPIDLDLYFERFLNPKRTSPPDFDIDYSWKDREDVQDYIFKRYGHEHTALLGATSTFKGNSIYRELSKVYGIPKSEIDSFLRNPREEAHQNTLIRKIHSYAEKIVNFPNIRSVHAGGIIISEKPLYYYTALDLPPKGFPTTQWDMYVAADLRFEKLDILSQRGIGHIADCADIIAENRAEKVDVHRVEAFKKDARVCQQLQSGETVGCFYIESPAMRALLKKLRCDNYLSLVAASSIIRPGVARSGMMREYIQRFHDPQGFEYLHPVMKEQLEETYGVMVYQEDVLKICHHFAGLDLADADVLRRAMSGKKRSQKEFVQIKNKFFKNCKNRGYSESLSLEVWRQIESFAAYSFSKAHSASYAVESYQSLFLKAHYPLEFMVAVINNFGGFYRTWLYFREAERQGGDIKLPCVNNSLWLTSIKGKEIFVGFVHINGLEKKLGENIPAEKNARGDFVSLEDFMRRLQLAPEQMTILIRCGAFRFTGKTKAALLWEMHLYFNKGASLPSSAVLFKMDSRSYRLPKMQQSLVEDAYDEIEYLGFPLSIDYFHLLQAKSRISLKASDLADYEGKVIRMMGILVCLKYVKTIKKELMQFGTFLDSDGCFFDTLHFPQSLKQYPFRGDGVYLVQGKVVVEFGMPSLEVRKMAKLSLMPDPRAE